MIYLAASICLQILCVLHAYKSGRAQYWPLVIIFFSLLGCFAYFVFEIMPGLIGPDSPRAAQARARKTTSPLTRLQQAEAALALVDTAASQMAVADAHQALGAHGSAADHFRKALDRMNGRDAKIEAKLAFALFESGQFGEALKVVEALPVPAAIGEADRLSFLRARIYAETGRIDEALSLYAEITTRLPGEEARCRYAALLLEQGRRSEALRVLEDVSKGLSKISKHDRAEHGAMFEWAEAQLATLRH
jgi:hypothetical protein